MLLAERHAIYQRARERNPRRWSGQTRNWTPISVVTLNPERASFVPSQTSPAQLLGSIGRPASPPRPGDTHAAARNEGDGRSGTTRSHAQRSEHGENGEHQTFTAVSPVAHSTSKGGATQTAG